MTLGLFVLRLPDLFIRADLIFQKAQKSPTFFKHRTGWIVRPSEVPNCTVT